MNNLSIEKEKNKNMKKLSILVASVLGASLLAIAPAAQATTLTVVANTWNPAKAGGAGFDTPASAGTTTATAIKRPVPEDNKIDNVEVIRFVATVAAGTSVTASATNATIVAALHTDAAPVNASSGSASLTVATGTGTEALFYVYTKTTAVGTVVLTNGVNTTTMYVQGEAGKVNTVALTGNDSGSTSSVVTVTATTTDVFGNKISGRALTALVVNGTVDTATATTGTTLTDFGSKEFKVTLPATGTTTLVVSAAAGELATAVAGFNSVTSSAVKAITVRDLAGELKIAVDALAAEKAARAADKVVADKALADAIAKAASDSATAKAASDAALAAKDVQIAKLTADNAAALAKLKASFNALAKKWNAKNPKAKVTLVK